MAETQAVEQAVEKNEPKKQPARQRNRNTFNIDEITTRADRKSFYERHRGAIVETEVNFKHPVTAKMFRRNFDQMTEWLHFIPVFGRVLLGNDKVDDVTKIEGIINEFIIKTTNTVNQLIREAHLVYQQNDVDIPTKFGNAEMIGVKLTSPLARIYFEFFINVDEFLILVNDLWVRGLLDPKFDLNEKKRSQYEFDGKRMINAVHTTIFRQYRELLGRIRRKQREATKAEEVKGEETKKQTKSNDTEQVTESDSIVQIEDNVKPGKNKKAEKEAA